MKSDFAAGYHAFRLIRAITNSFVESPMIVRRFRSQLGRISPSCRERRF